MDSEMEREAFEKWAGKHFSLKRRSENPRRYHFSEVEAAYGAWQAARTLPPSDREGKLVDVRLLNDAITLITKSLAGMLTDASFASPYVEDHRPRTPSWVMTHFRHDHDRRIEYVNDIRQRLDWIRNATAKVREPSAYDAPGSQGGEKAPISEDEAVEVMCIAGYPLYREMISKGEITHRMRAAYRALAKRLGWM